MQTYAAIDIGSNSCRLKIARVQQHQLKVLHEDREVTRLGASVFESGVVSPEAMASTLVALKRFYRTVKMHSADRVRAVATSALRDARKKVSAQPAAPAAVAEAPAAASVPPSEAPATA